MKSISNTRQPVAAMLKKNEGMPLIDLSLVCLIRLVLNIKLLYTEPIQKYLDYSVPS